ncbi:tRNA epoxyqueuosine(34) reductase QueG [Salinispira pacifica]|uniref:Epoxyqueuosine (OQ) reductase QueG n=1 Tax=Salinispira pacifica TaxID=1307761 RepID=V5WKB3_9SPIO|nr:tRNA epoxyqueuosine(34) reductase QueG [Salinispira pacifica]AHC15626.1 Epoxyqueuosine (oQ) reductase QueG [Salinispira pacifica]
MSDTGGKNQSNTVNRISDNERLGELIREQGIQYWGVCDADDGPQDLKAAAARDYQHWIAEGRHGSMQFLEVHEPMKFEPSAILPGTRSIISLALGYFPGRKRSRRKIDSAAAEEAAGEGGSAEGISAEGGRISLYARGRDYHKEFGRRIKKIAAALSTEYPGHNFRAFTDTAPLHERFYAEKAGMTFTGRNTLSLHRELGSYFFLGEILSTRRFVPTDVQPEARSHCPSGCTRCVDVCPTAALEAPYRINASTCISYLTIEHKGMIDPGLMEKMGTWIFGCDLCQDVCPFNIRAKITDVENFLNPITAGDVELKSILELKDHEEFTAMFAGTPVMRAGRVGMIRNAIIAAANGGRTDLLPLILERCSDGDEIISGTAKWAAARLTDGAAGKI